MKRPSRRLLLAAIGCPLALLAPLHAQPTPTASSDATPAYATPGATRLDEFRVTAASDNGYVTKDSLSGSRIATPVKDLPFSIQTITSDLMNDLGLFELNENASFISSFVGLQQGGQYNLRGFNQSYSLEDGFIRLGRYGTVNIDRVDVIKGPSAAVYGESTPGGTVNIITKEPRNVSSQSITLTAGSYRTGNVVVEAAGPITSKDSYIVDAGDYAHSQDSAFSELRNEEFYAALRHNFSSSSSLEVKFDYFHNALDAPQQILPENYDPVHAVYTGTLATNLSRLSRTGPDSWHDRGIKSVTVIYELQLSQVFSMRLGGNGYYTTYNDFNNGVNTQYDIVAHTIGRGTPSLNLFNDDGDALQADFVAHYRLFNGRVENRELLTFDFNDWYRWDKQQTLGGIYAALPYYNKTIIVGQPFDYTFPAYNTAQYNVLTHDYKNRALYDGVMFRHQTTLLDGRLIAYASAREDYTFFNLDDLTPGKQIVQHQNEKYFDPSFGFNAKVLPQIALYGSYSTGFDANLYGATASATSPVKPATTGWGDDYGIKANLLNDRLIFTLGGYYISKIHTTVAVLQPDGTTVNEAQGSQLSRGIEFDFTYGVTKALFFGGGYGHANSKVTNDGDAMEAVGRTPANVPTNNVGVYSRYTFDRRLTGLYTNLSFTYISPTHPEGVTAGDTISKGVYTGTNYQWAIKIPSYYYFDWTWHYQLRPSYHLTQTFGLVVKNVLNRFYVSSNQFVASGRGFYFTYNIRH